ncbi:HSP20-like chaperone [Akanthomyces lecanii RCEF 1005]|uniref:HSP20-like chaperone n=1 Tax=Akanthomyces lecanii RCEF 1005 TaxID=1081108 RepID=A0A168GX19_CORDF|nr:HSP20-like chaperone [Akanthomyces lecanii RCEF 1005]
MAFNNPGLHRIDRPFLPLYHIYEDFDNYLRRASGHAAVGWQPKFDIDETKEAYQLYGEFPGIKKEDVKIEFPEPQTIHIHGERKQSDTGSSPQSTGAGGDGTDFDQQRRNEKGEEATAEVENERLADEPKKWLTERRTGDFSRIFTFPGRVEHDNVSAVMEDGILMLTVPKLEPHAAHQVTIQ